MSLAKPRFQCGSYDVSPEHPSDWEVENVVGDSETTSLGGTTLRDIAWRKYQYTLKWDAINNEDYDDLEELFNHYYDTGEPITFTYQKWPQSYSGVLVMGNMSKRGKVAGSGREFFYSDVTITLTEINPR